MLLMASREALFLDFIASVPGNPVSTLGCGSLAAALAREKEIR